MKKVLKVIGIILVVLVIIAVVAIVILNMKYKENLKPVKEGNGQVIEVEIPKGYGASAIAKVLEKNNVIKDELSFKVYVKLNKINNLQAGLYEFNNGEDDVPSIIKKMQNGEIKDESIRITFVEGKCFTDYAKAIADATINTQEDVMNLLNDEEFIDSLIEKYWFITDEIKNEDIYYSLEGYLLPNTYEFENEEISAKDIIYNILNHTEKLLNEYKDEIEESEFSVHEILTLASLVELEGKNLEARQGIAGVFMNRLTSGMSLGSDVTTYYAFQINMGERDLTKKELNTENPYNTRGPNMIERLPVGPICNPSREAIEATLNPTNTDALYFVADKNGKVYFTKNNKEHNKIINQLKNEGLWYEY